MINIGIHYVKMHHMDQEKNGVVIASLEYLSAQPAGGSELLFLSKILTSPFSGLLCLKSCLSPSPVISESQVLE